MIGVLTVLLYHGLIALWAYIIIIGRDILITFYRQYLRNKNKPLVTSKYGKLKTVFQHIAVIFILVTSPTKELIDLVMGLNAIYAGATGIHYMVKNGF